ncbi:hypothetical protein ABZ419_19130 [Streptomyces cinnamoneus]|uniref:hypothetical protein n=1 Tax=Streptomyces cinnamoneus TaxID=53446 RepID=UPI003402245C
MSDALSQALAKLTAADVEVDESGRVVIKDQNLAQQLKSLSAAATPLGDNSNCNHGCRGQN